MSESVSRSGRVDTPRRTPGQSRPYLNGSFNLQQSPPNHSGTHSPHMIHETNSLLSQDAGVIYGTNISNRHVATSLEQFIQTFEVTVPIDGELVPQKIYLMKLSDLNITEETVFNVEGGHLKEYDSQLYYQFIYFPAQMISIFDQVLKKVFQKFYINNLDTNDQNAIEESKNKRDKLLVGITHLEEITKMRNLTPKEINRLICFRGIVIRCPEILPEMKSAMFRCAVCKTEIQVQLQNAKVQEPTECKHCKSKGTQQIIHNLCVFTDKQMIKFQELPEYVPDGQTPNSLTIISYDSNVDKMRPGDRVQVIGIYRAQSVKVNRNQSILKSVFNSYIDLISFRVLEDNRFRSTDRCVVFSDDDRRKFHEMAESSDVISDLVQSFAPSIYALEDIKKGILAQLFSGSQKKFSNSGRGHFRSDINICLVGDPSTAKSQLLQQVYKIAPRGMYTSGRGSSAVGLTANVRKDPQTKQFILQSGALVLSDLGICCIDQFDKMDQNSRTILLEAMQQQTISIAKAGIVCQLNSRTAILAAANPVNSKYNTSKSVVENINLSPALLSRFDLIYLMLDRPHQGYDTKLATHILDIYSNKKSEEINVGKYPRQLLAKYITYARQYVTPKISESAGRKLVSTYTEMRKLGNNKKIITATPRQLQSLIRISQAFAKMKLSNEVTQKDVDEAVNLIKVATQQAATDPVTGIIDMDVIMTGKTTASRQRVIKIKDIIKKLLQSNTAQYKKTSNIDNITEEIKRLYGENKEEVQQKDVIQALRYLETEGMIAMFGPSKSRPNFRLAKDLND